MLAMNAFEIGINLFEAILYLCFFKSRVHIVKNTRIPDVLAVIAYTGFLTLYLFFSIPFTTDSIGGIIFFIYLLLMSDERWYTCFLWVVFKEVVAVATITLVFQLWTSVFQIPYELVMGSGSYRVYAVLTINLALFLVFFSLSKIRKDDTSLERSTLFLFLGINTLVLVVIEYLFSYQVRYSFDAAQPFFIPFVALILIAILSILLFYTVTSLSNRKHNAELALNQAALSKDYQQSLKELYTDMIARQHDFKHQVETIRQLIQNGDTDAARAYFNAYEEKADGQGPAFTTGNLAMDALLTAKSITCANNQITFRFIHYPLNDLPISEVDLCAIVGNLLDNAIEAQNRIVDPNTQRWIKLSFARVWDMFYITCENSVYPSSIRKWQGKFLTSKTERASTHGFGIPNIISTAATYDGDCTFELKDQIFIANISFPYQAQNSINV